MPVYTVGYPMVLGKSHRMSVGLLVKTVDILWDLLSTMGYPTQWCQSNISSIEDIKTRQNRGGFRQKIESAEEMQ
jgi:hypothetical protein